MPDSVAIRRLATGVPGLDEILGGGFPELSFNMIVGSPGSGKTTLAHQIMFSLATKERPALFFTAFGEPPLKMLRYQQQFAFFEPAKLTDAIRFVNLSDQATSEGLDRVLARIQAEVEAFSPGLVFIDSFRAMMLEPRSGAAGSLSAQHFTQLLGVHLSGWQATSFLIGEATGEQDPQPVFSIADGLLQLEQRVYRNSMVRQLQVLKMRGQATRAGMQTFRISGAGIEIFPSALPGADTQASEPAGRSPRSRARIAVGVPRLDEMLGGGLPAGYSLLVAGPSGSGKTIMATAFLAEGVRRNEPGIIVAIEQTPSQSRVQTIDDMVRAGQVDLINTRSPDLSVDEIAQRLVERIALRKATRVVIDSLSGFELAVAPRFREDFRESLFRLVSVLSRLGVTVLMTSELEDRYTDLRFSPYGSAFLTDAILVARYIEIDSRLRRVLCVVKVRGSEHSNELREFEISDAGIVIGSPVTGYQGLLSGRPTATIPR